MQVFLKAVMLILAGSTMFSTVAEASEYKAFASYEEAATWYKTTWNKQGSFGDLLSSDETTYVQLKGLSDKAWNAMTELGLTKGVPKPEALVSKSEVPNAYCPITGEVQVNVMVFNAGLLKLVTPETAFGIIAHEMGHYVRGHFFVGVENQIRKYFQIKKDEAERPSILYANDPGVKSKILEWQSALYKSGGYSVPELNGLPYNKEEPSITQIMLTNLLRIGATDHVECKSALEKMAALTGTMASHASLDTYFIQMSGDEKRALDAQSKKVKSLARACVAFYDSEFKGQFEAYFTATKASLPQAANLTLDSDELVIAASDRPVFDKLMLIADLNYARLSALSRTADFPTYRYYTREDDADTIAALVTHKTKDFKFDLTEVLPETERSRCKIAMATKTVSYGNLANIHHSTCYRAYMTGEIWQTLERGESIVLPEIKLN